MKVLKVSTFFLLTAFLITIIFNYNKNVIKYENTISFETDTLSDKTNTSLYNETNDSIRRIIDARVEWINKCLDYEYYKNYYKDDKLIYQFFYHDFDLESFAQYGLYYDENCNLIFADITHYKGPMYSIYFSNNKLLHTEVGPFLNGQSFINGDIENVKAVINKDDSYTFVLEDVDICLKNAYK